MVQIFFFKNENCWHFFFFFWKEIGLNTKQVSIITQSKWPLALLDKVKCDLLNYTKFIISISLSRQVHKGLKLNLKDNPNINLLIHSITCDMVIHIIIEHVYLVKLHKCQEIWIILHKLFEHIAMWKHLFFWKTQRYDILHYITTTWGMKFYTNDPSHSIMQHSAVLSLEFFSQCGQINSIVAFNYFSNWWDISIPILKSLHENMKIKPNFSW